jgi:hypothetical protein
MGSHPNSLFSLLESDAPRIGFEPFPRWSKVIRADGALGGRLVGAPWIDH